MKIFIAILFFGMILSSGCSQSDSQKTDNEPNQEVITFTPADTVTDSISNTTAVESNAPTTVVSEESSDKLNPAHGEPGHRCDIPVGSPLNSSTPPVKTAPGMNPPHGEAGHDCAIPVGSPLKMAE